jgi:hypothetical protein
MRISYGSRRIQNSVQQKSVVVAPLRDEQCISINFPMLKWRSCGVPQVAHGQVIVQHEGTPNKGAQPTPSNVRSATASRRG